MVWEQNQRPSQYAHISGLLLKITSLELRKKDHLLLSYWCKFHTGILFPHVKLPSPNWKRINSNAIPVHWVWLTQYLKNTTQPGQSRGLAHTSGYKKTSLKLAWAVLRKIYRGITKIGFQMKNRGLTGTLRLFIFCDKFLKADKLLFHPRATRWQCYYNEEVFGVFSRLRASLSQLWKCGTDTVLFVGKDEVETMEDFMHTKPVAAHTRNIHSPLTNFVSALHRLS